MAQRGPLDELERRILQREYHKGTEAQRRVIRRLFGDDVTYSSCMALSEQKHAESIKDGSAGPISNLTEPELWEWVCRAAYHTQELCSIGIPAWIWGYRQFSAYGFRFGEDGFSYSMKGLGEVGEIDLRATFAPPDIPHNIKTRLIKNLMYITDRLLKGAGIVGTTAATAAAAIFFEHLIKAILN